MFEIISIKGMILLHFDEIAERSQPAMMALPPFSLHLQGHNIGRVFIGQ